VDGPELPDDETSRADRLEQRRGQRRRRVLLAATGVTALLVAGGAFALTEGRATDAGAGPTTPTTIRPTTTVTRPPTTTTTTVPPVRQPAAAVLPDPGGGLGWGSSGPVVTAYEARMKALRFDPGPVDGVYDERTFDAVVSVQKYVGQARTGRIDKALQSALTNFRYSAARPRREGNRVEIDLDRQVLTVFQAWQPVLVTTTSTGNGEYFCGGADGCQYAVTPTGDFRFYEFYRGWKEGKLGKMWNPVFFNGGIAVHGLASVPSYPASHGCARIPIYVADYFPDLIELGDAVYVVGTPKAHGDRYIGPVRNAPTSPGTAAPIPDSPSTTPTTKPPSPTPTTKPPTPTTKPPTPTTPPTTTPPTTTPPTTAPDPS